MASQAFLPERKLPARAQALRSKKNYAGHRHLLIALR